MEFGQDWTALRTGLDRIRTRLETIRTRPDSIRTDWTEKETLKEQNLHVVTFTFTLLEEGNKAHSSDGNHILAVFKEPEKYDSVYVGLERTDPSLSVQ